MSTGIPRARLFAFALAVGSLSSSCSGTQSSLNPAGPQAGRISSEWWMFLGVLGTIWVLVVAVMMLAVWRARGKQQALSAGDPPLPTEPETERKLTTRVTGTVAVTVVILLFLLFSDFFSNRAVSSPAPGDAMVISITGKQWWWDVHYLDSSPDKIITTANEVHIPTGKPVKFELNSTDVIHSFWIPNLHGKKDLIPGHPTSTWFVAEKAGTYLGQCAEFCGPQHAHMRLTIVAEDPEKYNAWADAQRKTPDEPTSDTQKRGQQVFLTGTCVMCHTVQGTPARSTVGPDLTHVASRQWIGAGALPNTRGYLGGWILDPQTHKPGVHMPQHTFSGEDLTALLDYIETLR